MSARVHIIPHKSLESSWRKEFIIGGIWDAKFLWKCIWDVKFLWKCPTDVYAMCAVTNIHWLVSFCTACTKICKSPATSSTVVAIYMYSKTISYTKHSFNLNHWLENLSFYWKCYVCSFQIKFLLFLIYARYEDWSQLIILSCFISYIKPQRFPHGRRLKICPDNNSKTQEVLHNFSKSSKAPRLCH